MKIFLSSHGRFASGLKSSLDILLGNSDNVTVYDAYLDETTVNEALDAFYETVGNEQVVLLSDLYGGSVNQVMSLYTSKPNTTLIAGVNLALVLELAIKTSASKDELEELVSQSQSMMRIVDLLSNEQTESDDFF